MKTLPRSRNTDVVVSELGDEILIYDLITHKAYNLNKTSSVVYQACGDGATFDDLKRTHQYTDDLIYLALAELEKADLLLDYKSETYFKSLTRREAIRKTGLSTMVALPIVSSLISPTAAMAQSCKPDGSLVSAAGAGAPICRSNLQAQCCTGNLAFSVYDPGTQTCNGGCGNVAG